MGKCSGKWLVTLQNLICHESPSWMMQGQYLVENYPALLLFFLTCGMESYLTGYNKQTWMQMHRDISALDSFQSLLSNQISRSTSRQNSRQDAKMSTVKSWPSMVFLRPSPSPWPPFANSLDIKVSAAKSNWCERLQQPQTLSYLICWYLSVVIYGKGTGFFFFSIDLTEHF